ncbi:MAG: DUF916 domain-containing protein [Acidimicrobiales bacterium]|jgi:hypothetical protein|nr:DUF916 domain-containing protein [Acidimicrobiales bacterium]
MTAHRRARPPRIAVALAALLAATALLAGPAGAADNGQFSVFPTAGEGANQRSFFVYNLDPGGSLKDSVTVTNSTDAPITFFLYASDVQENPDGAFALGNPDDPTSDVGAWVELPTDKITVPPQTAANIPFSLNVPTDATPGDHAGGIVALNEAVRAGDEGGDPDSNVNVAGRDGVGARIYLRVKGPVEAGLAVSSVSLSTSSSTGFRFGAPAAGSVSYRIVNTGNVRVSPTATARVEGLFGLGAQTLEPRALPELLPGASVEITEPVDSLPPLGLLTASVDVTGTTQGDGDVAASGDDIALAMPWFLLLVVALVVAAVIIRRRRSRRPPASPAPTGSGTGPGSPADTLVGTP